MSSVDCSMSRTEESRVRQPKTFKKEVRYDSVMKLSDWMKMKGFANQSEKLVTGGR
jgi:hypothetical protein